MTLTFLIEDGQAVCGGRQ